LYIIVGAFLGAIGQSIRVIIGVKKENERIANRKKEMKDWLDLKRLLVSLIIGLKRLLVSLIIGAIAGCLGAILLLGAAVNKEFLLGLVAIGYAGTDFIEGIMRSHLPK
jgi:hypothetical protein